MIPQFVKRLVRKHRFLAEAVRILRTRQVILLEYRVRSRPRYGHGQPPHPQLNEIIGRRRDCYQATLRTALEYAPWFAKIPVASTDPREPTWVNGYLPGLDSVALYSLLANNNPKQYVEIGSGHSTKLARRAIADQSLRTQITCIDPQPRADIKPLADTVLPTALEDADLTVFESLGAGDMVFYDGSHRCFMNSDVAVFFLDVLPRLAPGVLVQIHDVLLPYDYPPGYIKRYYSEQYLLATYLLAPGGAVEIVLPNSFISRDPALSAVVAPLFDAPGMNGVARHGVSFWIKKA